MLVASGHPWADGLSRAVDVVVEIGGGASGAVLGAAVLGAAVLGAAVLGGAVLDGAVLLVVGALEVVEGSLAASGRQDATTSEIGIANAAGIKRRRVIQVGGCSVNQSHPTARRAARDEDTRAPVSSHGHDRSQLHPCLNPRGWLSCVHLGREAFCSQAGGDKRT